MPDSSFFSCYRYLRRRTNTEQLSVYPVFMHAVVQKWLKSRSLGEMTSSMVEM